MTESNIIDKLDRVLDRLENNTKPSKNDVIEIIEILNRECPEDKILLLQTQYLVQNYWFSDKKRIKENLYFVLNYFNILKTKEFGIEYRKTYSEKVEGQLIKSKFVSKNKHYILSLLEGVT